MQNIFRVEKINLTIIDVSNKKSKSDIAREFGSRGFVEGDLQEISIDEEKDLIYVESGILKKRLIDNG